MKRVLVITYNFYPGTNPRATRWAAIAQHWGQSGIFVDVVCAEASPDPAKFKNVRIFGTWPARKPAGGAALVKNDKLRTLVKYAYDRTWKKLYWPDYAWRWYLPACTKARKLLRDYDYDLVISVSIPFTSHVVALKALSPRTMGGPVWITDHGDPFSLMDQTPPNNFGLYRALNRIVENAVLKSCDGASVTTDETQKLYEEHFKGAGGKTKVIPPLLTVTSSGASIWSGNENKIRLVFTGTLYQAVRRPEFLLQLFAELLKSDLGSKLELHFMGPMEYCAPMFEPYRDLLGRSLFIHGAVSKEKADSAVMNSQILVNIGNQTAYQLPSKVVQYMATGLPILNIQGIENDSSKRVLSRYPAVLNLASRPAPSSDQVEETLEFIKRNTGKTFSRKVPDWISEFQISSVADRYLEMGRRP